MEITNELIAERKQHLLNKCYSEKTIQNYWTDVKMFLKNLRLKSWVLNVDLWEITLKEIENRTTYLNKQPTPKTSIYYTKRPTLSQATIQWKLTAIKSLMKYINYYYEQGLDFRKIETKKIKSDYIECLTQTERELFFNFIGNYEKYRINALRMQLLCNIGYTSWLRLSEMLNLKVQDIKKKELRITWKWNKKRRVFFTNSTEELLENYLEERGKPIPRIGKVEKPSDFVFISHNSAYDFWTPIKKNVVCWTMKKYSEEINLWKRITIHSLRHSYATRLLESWLNIMEIKELLGHADVETTQTYCHVLQSNLKEKVNKIFE